MKDGGAGAGSVQLHEVPRDHDLFAHRRISGVGWQHGQMNHGIFFTADHVDNFTELHADDFDGLFAGLSDGHDLVVGLENPTQIGGAAGDDLFDDTGVFFESKDGPYAAELEFHLDGEILEGLGGEVGGVRVVEMGDGAEIELGQITAVDFRDVFEHALVTLLDRHFGLVGRFLVQNFSHEFKFQTLAPEFIRIGGGGGPFRLGPVGAVGFWHSQIDFLFQFLEDPVHAVVDPALIDIKDFIGGLDVTQHRGVIVDVLAVFFGERGSIASEEEQVLAVQLGHIVGNDLRVIGAADGVARVVGLLKELNQRRGLGLERVGGGEFPIRG